MPLLSEQLEIPNCPHCGVNSPNMPRMHWINSMAKADMKEKYWAVYSCQRCGGLITATAPNRGLDTTGIFPSIKTLDESIPLKAKSYLEQSNASIHAPAGAIMLAASAVDSMLKEKGLITGSLYNRIDEAKANHIITEDMAKWAHEIRLDANDQRHADVAANLPNADDARKCIDFALALAEILFVLPARIQRGIANAQIP